MSVVSPCMVTLEPLFKRPMWRLQGKGCLPLEPGSVVIPPLGWGGRGWASYLNGIIDVSTIVILPPVFVLLQYVIVRAIIPF